MCRGGVPCIWCCGRCAPAEEPAAKAALESHKGLLKRNLSFNVAPPKKGPRAGSKKGVEVRILLDDEDHPGVAPA